MSEIDSKNPQMGRGELPNALSNKIPRVNHADDGSLVSLPTNRVANSLLTLGAHKRLLFIWMMSWLAAAAAYLYATPVEYSSTASIILSPSRQILSSSASAMEQQQATVLDSSQVESQIQVIKSERILDPVFSTLQLNTSRDFQSPEPSALAKLLYWFNVQHSKDETFDRRKIFQIFSDRVTVKRVGLSYVIDISYRAYSPQECAKIANSITMQYLKSQIELKAASLQRGSEPLQGRISSIKAQLQTASEGVINGRIPDVPLPDADAQVVSSALQPLGKASPKTSLVIALSITFGLCSGIFIVVIKNIFARKILNEFQVSGVVRTRFLGSIPRTKNSVFAGYYRSANSRARHYGNRSGLIFTKAVEMLCTNICIQAPVSRPFFIGVISMYAGEGKSTIAFALAQALAERGFPAAIVDLHISKASSVIMGSENSPPLHYQHDGAATDRVQDVYASALAPDCVLIRPFGSRDVDRHATYNTITRRDLEHDGGNSMYYICDLGSLSEDAGAASLVPILDGFLIVAEAGKAKLSDLEAVIRFAKNTGIDPLGVALNKVRH